MGVRVRVHSRARLTNGYFFAFGLSQVFGGVRWTRVPDVPEADHFRRFVACEVDGLRLVFDYGDSPECDEALLDWAHGYGKVNCTAAQRAVGVVPTGPVFSIRPRAGARRLALRGSLGTAADVGVKPLLAERRNFLLRTPYLSDFTPTQPEPDYMFYLASLWEYANCLDSTNPARAQWMRSARDNPAIRFEGGFLPYPSSPEGPAVGLQVEQFNDLIVDARMPIREWLDRTRRSFAVFNNPAVEDCLGWKLGQYLALGKAIVSTPLTRQMPAPVIHGEHVHFIADEQDIPAAQELLRTDPVYRRHLQSAAQGYWQRYLSPEAVVRRVVDGVRVLT